MLHSINFLYNRFSMTFDLDIKRDFNTNIFYRNNRYYYYYIKILLRL